MPESTTRLRGWLDRLGATGSFLCALHCALLPLLLGVLPGIGLASLLSRGFEEWFVLFATVLGSVSLGWGFRRHRLPHAFALLLPGLAALWAGVWYIPLHEATLPHAAIMTLGGALVAFAHVVNLRLGRLATAHQGSA